MKKILSLLAFFTIIVFVNAQDLTVPLDDLRADLTKSNSVTFLYDGSSSNGDTLTSNQDTIHYTLLLNKPYKNDYYFNITLDTIGGADTTVVINIKGKMFSSESYTLIETTTTSAIGSSTATAVESMTDADFTYALTMTQVDTAYGNWDIDTTATSTALASTKDSLAFYKGVDTTYSTSTIALTLTVTPSIKPCYRYLLIELIISGDDATGTGIIVDKIEGYIQEIF